MAARDEREEEREFLRDLKARSGQDLAGWMAAISAMGFRDKNEAIDWLRGQGFPFARASWLERIHSNGGRPIYLENAPDEAGVGTEAGPLVMPRSVRAVATPAPAPESAAKPPAPSVQPVAASATVSATAAVQAGADEATALEALIAAAKGYRPLYMMLEACIRAAAPQAMRKAKSGLIVFEAGLEFAVVLPTASEIRLGLRLGQRPHDANLLAPRIKGAPASITHMLVLKDARQINPELQGLIAIAANGNEKSQG